VSVSGRYISRGSGEGVHYRMPSNPELSQLNQDFYPQVKEFIIECLAPPHSIGNVPVFISPNNGSDWVAAPEPLLYIPEPEILSAFPSSGSVLGGTRVVIVGLNTEYLEDNIVLCRFGVLEAALIFEDGNMTCVSPKFSKASAVPLTFSFRHKQGRLIDSIDPRLSFLYYDSIDFTSLQPKEGMSSGGTIITIKGSGFVDNKQLQARFIVDGFDPIYTPCVFVSRDTLTLTAPANPVESRSGFAVVAISNNAAVDFTESTSVFYWTRSIVVSSLSPPFMFESGSVEIDITGSGFVPSFPNTLRCRFGGQFIVDALFISSSNIQCTAPPAIPGNISVEVAQNGKDFIPAGSVVVRTTPRLMEIEPKIGSWRGTFLLIYICNFHVLNNLLLIYICKLHWKVGRKL
jgi:IPT/TIG domain